MATWGLVVVTALLVALGGPVQDAQVPARLSRAVRLDRGCAGLLRALLRLVQHPPSSQRDRDVHPGRRPSRSRGRPPPGSDQRPCRRVCRSSRAVREGPASAEADPCRGLDQPTCEGGAPSLISERSCLTGLDRLRPACACVPVSTNGWNRAGSGEGVGGGGTAHRRMERTGGGGGVTWSRPRRVWTDRTG